MFSTSDVGKRIAQLRKQANMTQVELADKMNVSYQAASNWERGISMPDISKLPDLAEIFGCSIDDLLNSEAPLISHIISGDAKEYISTGKVSSGEVADIAHILKPTQMDEIIETITETEHEETMEDIKKIAPIVEAEVTEKLVDNVKGRVSLRDIAEVVVHLPEDIIDRLIDRLAPDSDFGELEYSVVHLSSENIMKIIRKVDPKTVSVEKMSHMICHLDEDAVDMITDTIVQSGNKIRLDDIECMVVHLSEDSIIKMAHCIDRTTVTFEKISHIVVHISEETANILIDAAIENDSTPTLEGLSCMVVHLSEECTDKIIERIDKSDITFWQIANLAVHISEDSLDILVDAALKNCPDLNDADSLYPHLGEHSVRKILDKIMDIGDIEQLKRIAPFI